MVVPQQHPGGDRAMGGGLHVFLRLHAIGRGEYRKMGGQTSGSGRHSDVESYIQGAQVCATRTPYRQGVTIIHMVVFADTATIGKSGCGTHIQAHPIKTSINTQGRARGLTYSSKGAKLGKGIQRHRYFCDIIKYRMMPLD